MKFANTNTNRAKSFVVVFKKLSEYIIIFLSNVLKVWCYLLELRSEVLLHSEPTVGNVGRGLSPQHSHMAGQKYHAGKSIVPFQIRHICLRSQCLIRLHVTIIFE